MQSKEDKRFPSGKPNKINDMDSEQSGYKFNWNFMVDICIIVHDKGSSTEKIY